MITNLKYLGFFVEYLFLPILAIYFSLYVKAKQNSEQTLYNILEDLDIDFRIISGLGICLFGISVMIHNDSNLFYFYGIFGIVFTLFFIVMLLIKILNNRQKIPTVSLNFFGLSKDCIYKSASFQINFLYLYVVFGLTLKKMDHSNINEAYYFIGVMLAFTILFFFFVYKFLNILIISLLNNQDIYTFNNLYNSDVSTSLEKMSDKDLKRQIAEVSHLLANKKYGDPSSVPLLQNLSELYELQGESDKSILCIDKIISIYEDKSINHEKNNIVDAYVYKVELLKRLNFETSVINKIVDALKSKYPDNVRVMKL